MANGFDRGEQLLNFGDVTADEAISAGEVLYRTATGLAIADDADQYTAQRRLPIAIARTDAASGKAVDAYAPGGYAWALAGSTIAVGDTLVVEASTGRVVPVNDATSIAGTTPLAYTGTYSVGTALQAGVDGDQVKIWFLPTRFDVAHVLTETVNEAGGIAVGQIVKYASNEVLLVDEANQAAAQLITPFGVALEAGADGEEIEIAIAGADIVPLEAGANALAIGDFWAAEDGGDVIGETDITIADGDWYGGVVLVAASADGLGAGTFNPWQQQLA